MFLYRQFLELFAGHDFGLLRGISQQQVDQKLVEKSDPGLKGAVLKTVELHGLAAAQGQVGEPPFIAHRTRNIARMDAVQTGLAVDIVEPRFLRVPGEKIQSGPMVMAKSNHNSRWRMGSRRSTRQTGGPNMHDARTT
ncbi:MAG: hypothetical protein WDO18_13920 [Acidobacteriota bacterium]